MKKKIAIIGSGIAGLSLANFLHKDKNHDFMVYEKNESLPKIIPQIAPTI